MFDLTTKYTTTYANEVIPSIFPVLANFLPSNELCCAISRLEMARYERT